MRRHLSDRGLSWDDVAAIAEFCDVRPQSVYNIAVGFRDWEKARPMIVRHLYQHGWKPEDGRPKVRRWLNALSESLAP